MVDIIDLCEEPYQNGTSAHHVTKDECSKKPTTGKWVVLAKWDDRKYYPARIKERIAPNKLAIEYIDGYCKTVAESLTVSGDENSNVLPIINHNVSILMEKTIVGNCISVDESETDQPKYKIVTEMGDMSVEAQEIFLTEDQIKMMKGTYKSNGYATYNGNGLRRSNRRRKADDFDDPQPGTSGLCQPKRSRKTEEVDPYESDDSEYLSDPEPEKEGKRNLWDIEGVQTETLVIQADQSIQRYKLEETLGSNLDVTLGKLTDVDRIFRGKCFLLTCTYPINDKKKLLAGNKFTTLPFVRSHLENQIKAGGGVVYQSFENVPKNKQKMLRLIAPFSCLTPKYIQCLAAGIPIVSHEWIVDCSNESKLLDFKEYILPAGYSLTENKYLDWTPDRSVSHRKQYLPFKNSTIILGSYENDFVEFWKNVCKSAGATVRIAKRAEDITETLNGYLLTQEDFFCRNKARVEHCNIPIVSTVFVVESLICGKVIDPMSSDKLREAFEDEDDPTL